MGSRGLGLGIYETFTWGGAPLRQLPEDVVRLQEVIFDLKPEVIVETGVCFGGSLLFHATLCEAIGKGRSHRQSTIQIPEQTTHRNVESHRLAHRISLIEGDSAAPEHHRAVSASLPEAPVTRTMVILDSDHSRAHVLPKNLRPIAPLVTPGSCIIAEDGVMHDLADVPGALPGVDRPIIPRHRRS